MKRSSAREREAAEVLSRTDELAPGAAPTSTAALRAGAAWAAHVRALARAAEREASARAARRQAHEAAGAPITEGACPTCGELRPCFACPA